MDTVRLGGAREVAEGLHVQSELVPLGPWRRWIVVDQHAGGRRLLLSIAQRRADSRADQGADLDPDELQRRAQQAQAVVHPGLARVVESGRLQGGVWVLEELEGLQPLTAAPGAALPSGRELVAELVHLIEALGHAHQQGLVHGRVGRETVVGGRGALRLTGLALGRPACEVEPGPDCDVSAWAALALSLLQGLEADAAAPGPLAQLLTKVARAGGEWVPGDGRRMTERVQAVLSSDEGRAEMARLRKRRATGARPVEGEPTRMLARVLAAAKATIVGLLTTVLTAALLAGAVTVGLMFALEGGPREVAVPNVLGMTYEQAVEELGGQDLGVGVLRRVYDDDVPLDKIISTSPPPGMKVRQGREISMVVSRGSAEVKVPHIVGLQAAEAEKVLSKLGLKLVKDGQRRSAAPAGEVVSQTPAAEEMAGRNTEVHAVLSGGEDYGVARVTDADGETQTVVFRELEITVPQGEPIQRVTVLMGSGDALEPIYDRPHRPGDRVKVEVQGLAGKRVEVRIENQTVYKTQL